MKAKRFSWGFLLWAVHFGQPVSLETGSDENFCPPQPCFPFRFWKFNRMEFSGKTPPFFRYSLFLNDSQLECW